MSDQKDSKTTKLGMPTAMPVRPASAGESGSPGSIGRRLGGELDFEPDALLDSLLTEDELTSPGRDAPSGSFEKTPDLTEATPVVQGNRSVAEADLEDMLGHAVVSPDRASADRREGSTPTTGRAEAEISTDSDAPPSSSEWEDDDSALLEETPDALGAAASATTVAEQSPDDEDIDDLLLEPLPPSSKAHRSSRAGMPELDAPSPNTGSTARPPSVNPAGPVPRHPFGLALDPIQDANAPTKQAKSPALARSETGNEAPLPRREPAQSPLATRASSAGPDAFRPSHPSESPLAEAKPAQVQTAEGDAAPKLEITEDGDLPELDAAELDAAELDAAELDAAELDAAELDAAELDAAELDAAELDAAELDAAELDAAELDAAELDAAPALEADALEELTELPPSERPKASTRPSRTPGTSSLPKIHFPSERPAAALIAEQQSHDHWVDRADWFAKQAESLKEPGARARAWLVASELYAQSGDLERSRQAAQQSASLAPALPMTTRQARQLALAAGDASSVTASLELETRTAPTAEARAHAALLSSEVHRLRLGDETNARRKLDLASRAVAEDVRPVVEKLAAELRQSPNPPKLHPQNLAEPLSAALKTISKLRGERTADETSSALLAFEAARRALRAGDRRASITALSALLTDDELKSACRFLIQALAAPDKHLRPEAIRALEALLSESPSPAIKRALAARALEAGEPEALRHALQSDATQEAFSAADRIALSALFDQSSLASAEALQTLATEKQLPLAHAALALSGATIDPSLLSGSESTRAEVRLGMSLASSLRDPKSPLSQDALDGFSATHPAHPLPRLIAVESAVRERQTEPIAAILTDWPASTTETALERSLAAALLLELGGDPNAAIETYRLALTVDPTCEAALRALATPANENAAGLLTELAERTESNTLKALLFTEAAVRLGSHAREYGPLLERASQADPSLPFACQLGEQLSRTHGNAEQLLTFIRLRRERSTDPIEAALDEVREALLIADQDPALAASLLSNAVEARPTDIGLRELHERVAVKEPAERALWRESSAASLTGRSQQELLLLASTEFERAEMTEAAARTARAAAALGPNVYAESVAERLSIAERDAGYLSERLFEQARQESDAVAQRELYDVLSRIDEARGESSSALLWQSAILERSENHLPSLRKLEHAYISQGRDDELESVASRLATILDAGESDAHVSLALQLRARRGEWASGKELAEIAAQRETPSLWALRALSVQAHFADDPATIFKVDQKLLDFAPTPLDKATFALRAAEAAVRLSELETAEKLLQTALSHVPEHLVALTTLGEVLERLERFEEAARVFETLAIASQVPAHRVSALYQAACLWQEKAGQEDQATRALEEAADYDILHREVFARLRDLYIKQDERAKLAGLLERRLAQTQDPDERIAIEVMRGKALAGVGEHEEAKRALAAALDNNPEHADALEAFADLCRDSGDYTSAEQAYIRLVRHVADPERQAGIYRRLAALYDGPLPNLERAELAHQEVLKRVPGDVATAERLILVYGRMDQKEKALALQQELIEKAETTEDKRDRTLGLSRLYETVLGDKRKAQLTLDRARRTFHHDEVVLTATVEFHRRQDDERSLGLLLDRTLSEARRALGTGRFDRGLFQVLAAAAEHKGELGLASLARASLAAIDGTPSDLAGAAQGAADPALDDLLSPEHVGLPLRSLLEKAGAMLDAAYPVDLRTLRAAPLPTEAQAFKAEVAEVATSFGIPNLDVFVAPQLGKVCLGISSFPPQVVFGQELIDSDDEALRSFLLIRALKLVSVQGTAITRMAPIDLWPNLAGFLSVLCPEWEPPPMDAGKLSAAKQRVEASLTRRIDDDVPLLALEVANTIGNRASQLGTLFFEWANRTALLAVGDPGIALRAIASASGHELPQDQTQRLKWIGRNSEARDLMVFSITDAYAEARKRVGL